MVEGKIAGNPAAAGEGKIVGGIPRVREQSVLRYVTV